MVKGTGMVFPPSVWTPPFVTHARTPPLLSSTLLCPPFPLLCGFPQEKARATNVFMADDALARAKVTFRWEGWSSQQVHAAVESCGRPRRFLYFFGSHRRDKTKAWTK